MSAARGRAPADQRGGPKPEAEPIIATSMRAAPTVVTAARSGTVATVARRGAVATAAQASTVATAARRGTLVRAAGARATVGLPPIGTGGTGAGEQPGASRSSRARRTGRPQPSSAPPVLRVVGWQLALISFAVAVGRDWPVAAALGGSAAVLLAVSGIRVRGTWLSTLLARRIRLLARPRSYRLPESADRPAALLALLVRGARVGVVELGGAPAGVVSGPHGVVAILRPEDTDVAELLRATLSGTLETGGAEPPSGRPAGVEATPGWDEAAPGPELRLVLHRGPRQAQPRAWLAVRVPRTVDAAEDETLHVVLGNAIRRVIRRLRRGGLDLAVLPDREVLATLTALTHAAPDRSVLREEWRYWRAGPVTQIVLRLSSADPASIARIDVLDRLLAAVPEVAITVAVTADPVELTGMLRVAASSPAAADAAAGLLAGLAPRLGIRLERMDGRHGPAVAASLPIGGNLE
ncbi:type VII secretion protein EccE [Micromonospora sp. NPDC007230]|uniref:type VII secretion protein EccE n=1 Tax=Micromonospora sp. NPDC007230 TaxID=3364237 RepID=UPI0036B8F6FA